MKILTILLAVHFEMNKIYFKMNFEILMKGIKALLLG